MPESGTRGDDPLHPHPSLGQAEMQRIVTTTRKLGVHIKEIANVRCLRREQDAIVRQPGGLREFGRLRCRTNDRFDRDGACACRGGRCGVLLHQFRQEILVERPPVHTNAHRFAMVDRHLDDRLEVLVAVLAPHVARIDSILGEEFCCLRVRGKQLMAVVVKVPNDWRREPIIRQSLHDLGDCCSRCIIVHRNSYDLTSSACEVSNLCRGAGSIRGVGVGHRLHHDRVGGAHHHATYGDARR